MTAFLIGALSSAIAQEQPEGTAIVFDIPAQSMADALQAFAKQADLQILFKPESLGELRAPGLSGRMTVQQALDVLLKDTGLEHVRNGDVVVVRSPNRSSGTPAASKDFGAGTDGLAIAQMSGTNVAGADQNRDADGTDDRGHTPSNSKPVSLGETLVTGTLIRGAAPASTVIIMERDDIDATGYATLHEVVRSIPQNYAGGENEATQSFPGGSTLNLGFGSAVNLRGLGSDSTLTLLNGQRLAPAAYGQFVDISLIPLSAVERIEVLPDGASATYGADAVGGVVNIILHDDYEGAETLLRGGAVTEGNLEEYQLSQTVGGDWTRASALLTYEYFRRSNLDANDRDYSASVRDPFDLLPSQERNSAILAAHLDVHPALRVRTTTLYSERDAQRFAFIPTSGRANVNTSTTRQVNSTLGAVLKLSDAWQADLVGTYGRNRLQTDSETAGLAPAAVRNRLTLESLDAKVDGTLFALPAGPASLALGGSYREEEFVDEEDDEQRDRQVTALFMEINVPVLERLQLSLAARYEDHSDFGDTTNPKYGLLWSPVPAVMLRATYGTSYRAPLLSELDDGNVGTFLANIVDPAAPDGRTLSMVISGNRADLTPEEATTWTAGVEFAPAALPALELSLTYFNTEFTDRIVRPLQGLAIFGIYSQADVYAPLITRDPDDATVSTLAAHPRFSNLYGPFTPAEVETIVDRRLQNLSVTEIDGLDLALAYGLPTRAGDWSFRLDASYLLDFTDAITRTATPNDVLSTAYNPIDLKGRARVGWSRKAWSASVAVHYADEYVNNTVTPNLAIDSWTTADLQVAYAIPQGVAGLGDTRLALSIQNALDEDPPFMTSPAAQFNPGFDPTNSSPLGRFISLSAVKTW